MSETTHEHRYFAPHAVCECGHKWSGAPPLDVERLAVAMNAAQIDPSEIRLGRDLTVPARRIAAAYERLTPQPRS